MEIEVDHMFSLESDVVRLLLTTVTPGMSEADILERMATRHSVSLAFASVLTPEGINSCSEVLGDDSVDDMKEEVQAYLKKVAAAKVATPKPAGKAKAKARVRKVGRKDHETLNQAKKFLPDLAGVTLCLQTDWHIRWRVEYPRDVPPYSH